jgi:hypothetical protein
MPQHPECDEDWQASGENLKKQVTDAAISNPSTTPEDG